MIVLPAIKETGRDFKELEDRIREAFKRMIYLPLLRIMKAETQILENSKNSLTLSQALKANKVWYEHGGFSGEFSGQISKTLKEMGATWDKDINSWRIPIRQVPIRYQEIIAQTYAKNIEKLKEADKKLTQISPAEIAQQVKSADLFNKGLWKTNEKVAKTLRGISIEPKLTPEQRSKIADEWQNNMDLWIKNFAEEEIPKLRKQMQEHIFAGGRYESMIKTIQDSYGVTSRKAKFLARQETGLLMSKFKETQYTSAGVFEYKWKCVSGTKLHPVRPRHRELNDMSAKGHIFRFDDPPNTAEDGQSARFNNPGADYNCRCVALPVVRFDK